jgi:hypothetical protein
MTLAAALPSLAPPSPAPNPRFVRSLGPHHFAYLRAVAEGLSVADCARRYSRHRARPRSENGAPRSRRRGARRGPAPGRCRLALS